jgi:glycosyltransferase involved in cell wall biosynthesis
VQLYHGYNYSEIDAVLQGQILVNERYIVFVGRLEKIKGPHTVLKAIKSCPGISLKIVGTGTQEQELKQFVLENGMDNVSFEGKKSRKETLQLIKNAEFLICASEWYEVLGFTVVEAMALGKPVIGSAIGAIPEMVIDNYTGRLFEPGNYTQLGKLITMLYADSDLMKQMGQNARQHITTLIDNNNHYTGLKKLVPGL